MRVTYLVQSVVLRLCWGIGIQGKGMVNFGLILNHFFELITQAGPLTPGF